MKNVHMILDEAAILGRLEVIENILGIGRGYGIRLTLVFQSLGQLSKCVAEGQDVTVLGNTTQIFLAVNDNQTADYISAKLGDRTISIESGSTTYGTSTQYTSGCHPSDSHGSSTSYTDSWSFTARRLLKPEEVQSLPDRMAITFTNGVPPICSWMLRYYEEGDLHKTACSPKRLKQQTPFKAFLLCVSLFFAAMLLTKIFIEQQQTAANQIDSTTYYPQRQRTYQRRPYETQ